MRRALLSMPCLKAFFRDRFFPALVFGPVDIFALRRFASSFLSETDSPLAISSTAAAPHIDTLLYSLSVRHKGEVVNGMLGGSSAHQYRYLPRAFCFATKRCI